MTAVLFAASLALLVCPTASAQEKDKKHKEGKEYKENKEKKNKKDKGYQDQQWHENQNEQTRPRENGALGGILGRVILPPRGTAGPRQLQGVPKGHYPPPGQCRIWYPNRPPGHQPPPTDCQNLYGARLEPGAFILSGDRAYDAEYDWREEERRRPGSVTRDILDILFPRR
ncbi:hypothetical protein ACD591_15275 [Rufibacter glacialis]|uniref:Uncharacterized protein n=1 Tax=Rufibacter glacialis TaxID=1259555 RepID=A0A5M8QN88_9BACT|nr:hypothetical protein [Rufibacter glacialis]KAA6437687.1 hypothetical protein FOE74_04065 [Rufibacter glacialis]GGK57222.1 hypothetical protein GCM10011405_01630 [Rufibacter glacialis]